VYRKKDKKQPPFAVALIKRDKLLCLFPSAKRNKETVAKKIAEGGKKMVKLPSSFPTRGESRGAVSAK